MRNNTRRYILLWGMQSIAPFLLASEQPLEADFKEHYTYCIEQDRVRLNTLAAQEGIAPQTVELLRATTMLCGQLSWIARDVVRESIVLARSEAYIHPRDPAATTIANAYFAASAIRKCADLAKNLQRKDLALEDVITLEQARVVHIQIAKKHAQAMLSYRHILYTRKAHKDYIDACCKKGQAMLEFS